MSSAPTSEDRSLDPALLEAAGWTPEELAWECRTEAAVARYGAGEDALSSLGEVLRLARAEFSSDDPRLATSLANYGAALRQRGDARAAEPLFTEALLVWDRAQHWIARLAPEHRARSAMYHFRLKTRYPGGYDRFSRARYLALASEGREATLALRNGTQARNERLQRWRQEKPEGFTARRKLLAAALLLV